MKLNLGCGTDIRAGYVNADIAPLAGVEVVCNLNRLPLPFADGEFTEVYCRHVLEHVQDLVVVMEEIHRILSPGGLLRIEGPHYSSPLAYTDPTHERFFAFNSMRYFSPDYDFNFYSNVRFKIIAVRLEFTGGKAAFMNVLIDPLVNLMPNLYERLFAWILPVENVYYTLQKP
jgi:SAM-dependent methyltransferase